MGCCRGKIPVANVSSRAPQTNSKYQYALANAQDDMWIETLIDQVIPSKDSPEAMRRAVRAQLVKDLHQRGFRVTPAGRIMKR